MSPDAHIRIETASSSGNGVRLLAVGDFCLTAADVSGRSSAGGAAFYSPELLELLAEKDLSIANLECPIVLTPNPIVKSGPCLSGASECIDALRTGGFDVVGLANNHVMDHGSDAMFRTREQCELAGMRTVGVGADVEEAGRPLIMEAKGLRVGVVALGEQEFACAEAGRPGCARLEPITAARIIGATRNKVDVLIVYAHGGKEYYPLPTPRIHDLYRFCIDCGADVVLGHHTHVLQGVEIYQGRPIVYSLGNFLFPTSFRVPTCWRFGLVCRLTISSSGVSLVELFQTEQDIQDSVPVVRVADPSRLSDFRQRFEELSRCLSDRDAVRQAWACHCEDVRAACFQAIKSRAYVFRANLAMMLKSAVRSCSVRQTMMAAAELLGRFPKSRAQSRRDQAVICNLLRCPSHHETLVQLLQADLWPEPVDPGVKKLYDGLVQECR